MQALAGAAVTSADDADRVFELFARRGVAVLTGAGCSTESGIPDYRGAGRPVQNPILHQAFIERAEVRRRYWARATVGWARFSRAEPNRAHRALSELERVESVRGIITQNVDRLHHRAGSRRIVELHGALDEVICLGCSHRSPRADVHERLVEANPDWIERPRELAPDGDSELDPDEVARFRVVECRRCGGVLKPDVVFFGGSVAPAVVAQAYALLDEASALIVVGSSLTVYSGFRFVLRANQRRLPVAVVNVGPTRADELDLHARVSDSAGAFLGRLVDRLSSCTIA